MHDLGTVVRVPQNAPNVICRVLDSGARGIVVPGVTTVGDAERAVRHTRYNQLGNRGVGSGWARSYGYLMQVKYYVVHANEQILLVVLLEHISVLEHLDAMLAVSGLNFISSL